MKKLIALSVFVVGSIFGLSSFVRTDSNANSNDAVNASSVSLQEEGINFRSINFENALKEAKETNKIIFIDAYTVWCGPCKKMAASTFMDQNVSEVFNSKFINLKIEMEKDADADKIARLYKVLAYPTLLFIDSNGKLIKSAVGFQDANSLVNIAKSI